MRGLRGGSNQRILSKRRAEGRSANIKATHEVVAHHFCFVSINVIIRNSIGVLSRPCQVNGCRGRLTLCWKRPTKLYQSEIGGQRARWLTPRWSLIRITMRQGLPSNGGTRVGRIERSSRRHRRIPAPTDEPPANTSVEEPTSFADGHYVVS
jgi:hypothetical protein